MPQYEYQCLNCKYEFEVFQKNRKKKKKCPSCKKPKLERLISRTFGHGEPNTIGALAEKNTRKMGKYEKERRRLKRKQEIKESKEKAREKIKEAFPRAKFKDKPKKTPWYGKAPEKLKDATKEQKEKYIMTGKLP